MCACICIHTHTHIYTDRYRYVFIYEHIYICIYISIDRPIDIDIHIHIYIYIGRARERERDYVYKYVVGLARFIDSEIHPHADCLRISGATCCWERSCVVECVLILRTRTLGCELSAVGPRVMRARLLHGTVSLLMML